MVKCISVTKRDAECVIIVLKKRGYLSREYRVMRYNEKVLVPINELSLEEVAKAVALCTNEWEIMDCQPPEKKTERAHLPSLDIVDNVVIVRENVLRSIDVNEFINNVRRVYPKVKAIWVKSETVDVFRTPVLKLVWGEEVRDIIAKEYGLKFKVKLGSVYFNPRLSEEHYRIANLVKPGEVVVDMFSGVGGFTIHIASSAASLVIANDINPLAYELLLENVSLNRRKLKGTIVPLNVDSKELPDLIVKGSVDRIVADFPTGSLDFTDEYDALLKSGGTLHLYILAECEDEARIKVLKKLGSWTLRLCVEVLEYSPRLSIYRCDLIKP